MNRGLGQQTLIGTTLAPYVPIQQPSYTAPPPLAQNQQPSYTVAPAVYTAAPSMILNCLKNTYNAFQPTHKPQARIYLAGSAEHHIHCLMYEDYLLVRLDVNNKTFLLNNE